ncbi:hypothetical protein [Nocardia jejuensis]|uniref:hypothetical protein n=1 Tax=Nocardia jejuensis TaxID=328049 RepID=UPI00083451E0|nr:hypothetical protein [Nocardia jejuensis]
MPTNDSTPSENIGDSAERLADDVGSTAGDLAGRAGSAAGQLAEKASAASAELADRATNAAADLADMAKAFADRFNTEDMQGTVEQVRANLEHAAQDVMAAVNEIITALKDRVGGK